MVSAVKSVFALLLAKVNKTDDFEYNKPQINPKTIKPDQKQNIIKIKKTV